MPAQGRLGDKAKIEADSHGCLSCAHTCVGPAVSGSMDVYTNGKPSLRVDDNGTHTACCGSNTWKAETGSSSVYVNGRQAHRKDDTTKHCGGIGKLIEGSDDVFVGGGSQSSSADDGPETQSLWVRFEIPPAEAGHSDVAAILTATRSGAVQTKRIACDSSANSESVDVQFAGLDPSDSYSLRIDSGGSSTTLFQDIPFHGVPSTAASMPRSSGADDDGAGDIDPAETADW